jgi:hypothetical protein
VLNTIDRTGTSGINLTAGNAKYTEVLWLFVRPALRYRFPTHLTDLLTLEIEGSRYLILVAGD